MNKLDRRSSGAVLNRYLRFGFAILSLYLVSFVSWFVALTRSLDVDLLGDYLYWAWNGGGELPAFTNFFALATTVIITAIYAIVRWLWRHQALKGNSFRS